MTTSQPAQRLVHEVGPDAEVDISIAAGDIQISGTDDSSVRAQLADGRPIEEVFDVTAEGDWFRMTLRSDVLRVGPLRLGLGGGASVDLRLHVPRGVRINVQTASADIEADGLNGEQRFSTASGSIQLAPIGGRVTVDSVSGDVSIRSTETVTLQGRTVSGDIVIDAPYLDEMRLTTTSGDLRLAADLAAPGPHVLETVSGSATISTASPLRIDATSVSGSLDVDGNTQGGWLGKRSFAIGDGSVGLSFRSMSGDLRVRTISGRATRPALAAEPRALVAAEPPAASEAPALTAVPASADAAAAARMATLRALERGEIDVTEAMRRIEALEPSGSSEDASHAPLPPLGYLPRDLQAPFDGPGIA